MKKITYFIHFTPKMGDTKEILKVVGFYPLIQDVLNDTIADLDLGDEIVLSQESDVALSNLLIVTMTTDGIKVYPSNKVAQPENIGVIGVGTPFIHLIDRIPNETPIILIDFDKEEEKQFRNNSPLPPFVLPTNPIGILNDTPRGEGKAKGGNNKPKDPKKRKGKTLFRDLTKSKE